MDEFQEETKKEVVVDYFGWKISSSYINDYLDDKLDADDNIRFYEKVTTLWGEAHNVKMIKIRNESFSRDVLPAKEADMAFDYLFQLFEEKGVDFSK